MSHSTIQLQLSWLIGIIVEGTTAIPREPFNLVA